MLRFMIIKHSGLQDVRSLENVRMVQIMTQFPSSAPDPVQKQQDGFSFRVFGVDR